MAERTLVVDRLKFSYEGLFSASELYNLIATFFFEKGWDWYEKMNQEIITTSGKQIKIVLEPWKSSSDYYKLIIAIKLIMTDVREVEVEEKGEKIRVNHGIVHITFDGYVVSDRKGKWTVKEKPFYWFLSVVLDKYFFRHHFEKLQAWVTSDVDDLYAKIKNYLNVFNYTYRR